MSLLSVSASLWLVSRYTLHLVDITLESLLAYGFPLSIFFLALYLLKRLKKPGPFPLNFVNCIFMVSLNICFCLPYFFKTGN